MLNYVRNALTVAECVKKSSTMCKGRVSLLYKRLKCLLNVNKLRNVRRGQATRGDVLELWLTKTSSGVPGLRLWKYEPDDSDAKHP